VPASFDVVIVGGGAIGAACAREIGRGGHRVALIEPGDDRGQAWRAAAGMLAPQIEADGSDSLLALGTAARDHYDRLVPALEESTGIAVGLWREGIARVATEAEDAVALQTKVAWQRDHGLRTEWLEPADLRRRWSWLGPALGALWAPDDGALDPGRLVRALLADAQRSDVVVVADRANSVRRQGEKVTGVIGERDSYSAPDVVIAAGAWSPLIEGLPRTLPVQPVRGQMAALPWPPNVARAIVYHRDAYLLARGSEAILGSTMEYVGFDPQVTRDGVARIFSATMALCPGLVRAKVRRTWAGLRPVTPDGLPVIGADPALQGLWYATGHGRNGILLAGLTGLLVAQLLSGDRPTHDLRRFAPDRFGANPSP
jgi:glycine oxidase